MENPIKMDDLGKSLFLETPTWYLLQTCSPRLLVLVVLRRRGLDLVSGIGHPGENSMGEIGSAVSMILSSKNSINIWALDLEWVGLFACCICQ